MTEDQIKLLLALGIDNFFSHAFSYINSHIFSVNNNLSSALVDIYFPFLHFSLQDLIIFILIKNSVCYHSACSSSTVQRNNAWTTI